MGKKGGRRHATELSVECKTFTSRDGAARWDDCNDGVRREVVCKKFIDDLKCDCLEDGVEKWTFRATDPPLDSRVGAWRVATANCRMSFGN